MSDVTPGAEALSFFVDLDNKTATLRLYSSANDHTAETWNAREALPRLLPFAEGVWETVIQLQGDEKTRDHLFGVMDLFGFGIYL
jgi:hypothetical protein